MELSFDAKRLQRIADEFSVSEKDLRKAYSRALSRTARTMRVRARAALRKGLDLRSAAILKARLRLVKMRPRGQKIGAARLWVGTNDMPADSFKGRPQKTSTGISIGGRDIPGGFVGTSKDSGKQMIFRRTDRQRQRGPNKNSKRQLIERATVATDDEMKDLLEQSVFDEVSEIFFKNFRAEVRARTIYSVGK